MVLGQDSSPSSQNEEKKHDTQVTVKAHRPLVSIKCLIIQPRQEGINAYKISLTWLKTWTINYTN